jgi:SAM-dependent methyltransferase
MAWYKEWFGEEYLELYSHRNDQEAEEHVEFVERFLGGRGGRGGHGGPGGTGESAAATPPRAVLDLACGTGRHTVALRRLGLRALGADLSLTLLAQRRGLPRVAVDMRSLPFRAGSFDWVLNFFTSFGYFETERENFQVLEEIVRILAPGGRFLIDIMNSDLTRRRLTPRETRDRDGRRVEIERWYDAASRRINKRIRVRTPGRGCRTFLESVRAYRQEEVAMGLHWAGLEVDALFGNFRGEPFTDDSERLIFVGTRPA